MNIKTNPEQLFLFNKLLIIKVLFFLACYMKTIPKHYYYGIFINKQHYDNLPPHPGGYNWRLGIQTCIELTRTRKDLIFISIKYYPGKILMLACEAIIEELLHSTPHVEYPA